MQENWIYLIPIAAVAYVIWFWLLIFVVLPVLWDWFWRMPPGLQ